MDYVFFAANALCVGFFILLVIWLKVRRGRGLRLVHYLACTAGAFAYYALNVSLLSRWVEVYYIANTVPILMLAALLGLILWPHSVK